MRGRIAVTEGDLAEARVDAVVLDAAGELPLPDAGGPRAAGAVGEAVLTDAGPLPARFAIRAAVAAEGGEVTEAAVRAAFRAALALARDRGLATLAVGALGAGAGGLSLRRSAEVLIEEARRHLGEETPLEEIRFVVAGEQALRIFEGVQDSVRIAEQLERLAGR